MENFKSLVETLNSKTPYHEEFNDSGDEGVLVTECIAENKAHPQRVSTITDKFQVLRDTTIGSTMISKPMSSIYGSKRQYFHDYESIDQRNSGLKLKVASLKQIAPKTSRNVPSKPIAAEGSPVSRNQADNQLFKFPLMSSSSSNSPVLRAHVNKSNYKAQNFKLSMMSDANELCDTLRQESSPRALLGSPGLFDHRHSIDATQSLSHSFDDSLATMRASEELLCGCECPKKTILSRHCSHAQRWLEKYFADSKFDYVMFSKTYECFLQTSLKTQVLQNQIKKDVERTFQTNAYFRDREVQRALGRLLLAYAHYEPQIGYVQGMNFIAAALLYHAGEVVGFWLFISLIDALNMKEIFRQGLPGVCMHDQALASLGKKTLPEIFSHFVSPITV